MGVAVGKWVHNGMQHALGFLMRGVFLISPLPEVCEGLGVGVSRLRDVGSLDWAL